MSLYHLPEFKLKGFKKGDSIIPLVVFVSVISGFIAGTISGIILYVSPEIVSNVGLVSVSQEELIIKAVALARPAVVSIIVTKDVPIYEQYWNLGPFGLQNPEFRQNGTERKQVGGGTGFIVSSAGLIVTNKHVVKDDDAEYTIFTNNGDKFKAKVLAKDPSQDLALMMIEQESKVDGEGNLDLKKFPVLKLGDSDDLRIGQSVIAIGNALGEFRNTVSLGIISALGRRITASGQNNFIETLNDVIQTDTAINRGNSGGPLLNLKGEVIGINTAIANDAQSIGFSIPVNYVKRDIDQIQEIGRISYPFIGIRYIAVSSQIKEQEELPVDYGILIVEGKDQPAISVGSPAEGTDIARGDIILEFDGQKITATNTLIKIMLKYNPGDEVTLKVLKKETWEEINVSLILSEREE